MSDDKLTLSGQFTWGDGGDWNKPQDPNRPLASYECRRVVHKVALDSTTANEAGLVKVLMPWDAKIVHIGYQRGLITLWYLRIDDGQEPGTARYFLVRETGQPLPREDRNHPYYRHIGTVFTDPEGTYVLHVFESGS